MLSFQPQKPRSPIVWLLFSLAGRISRSIYWLGYLFIISVQLILLTQMASRGTGSFYDEAVAVGPVIILATLYWNIAIAVKRLHDVGYGGFLALALLIPIVNVAFTLWVGFLPGTAGPNRFGDVADVPPP